MKIAIASGKGGTGKTTLSTNLATFLGETKRVVLVDLDVEEPNAKLFIDAKTLKTQDTFKMIPHWNSNLCTQCAQCVEICNYNALIHIANEILVFPNLCHSCYACSELCPTQALPMEPQKMGELTHWRSDFIDGVEGRLNIGEEQAVSLIAQTKKYVEKYFSEDTVKIYDAPPGTSCPMVEAIKDVSFVILITEPTPFGLHDLKLAVETVRAVGKKFGVVINQFGIGNDMVLDYCRAEHIDIIAKIPHDRAVAMAYSKGDLAFRYVEGFKDALQEIVAFCEAKGLA
ncbi:MAG: ATP-binding protein [Campylobacteraceae bacterium]|nr:ATP-binding protein [Campylobacteraceae bacterium]